MYQVVKRDGKAVDFNIKKISDAITKAFNALDKEYHPSVIDMLALRVTSDFAVKVKDEKITVEDIQDSVEKVLSESGYADVAKAYILYPFPVCIQHRLRVCLPSGFSLRQSVTLELAFQSK